MFDDPPKMIDLANYVMLISFSEDIYVMLVIVATKFTCCAVKVAQSQAAKALFCCLLGLFCSFYIGPRYTWGPRGVCRLN